MWTCGRCRSRPEGKQQWVCRAGQTRAVDARSASGGVAVIHRCPEVGGVVIKTTLEPMGVAAEQAKAALGRRPGKNKDGGTK